MGTQRLTERARSCCVAVLFLTLTTLCAPGASPKRVLILDSFGRDVAPFDAGVEAFRTTLARELGQPVDFYEVSLDMARLPDPSMESAFVDFLEHRFGGQRLDLVAPFGAPAARFTALNRQRLFPDAPIVFTGVDPRLVRPEFLRTNATLVTQANNLTSIIEDILQMRPQTTNIVVLFGASPLEKFWVSECHREFQPFTNRVSFSWLDNLSLDDMRKRIHELPPRSFILYGMMVIDAAGVPYANDEALKVLHAAANAPVFGYFESQLGLGAIGGRLYQDTAVGEGGARAAVRILRGEKPGDIAPQILGLAAPAYDWRELRRWGIDEARLPSGSKILFRQPTLWENHRWSILTALLVCLGQAGLIALLTATLARRRRAERALRESEERFRQLLEQAPDAIIVYDLDQQTTLQANTQAERLFGCSRRELMASAPHHFYASEQPDGQPVLETVQANCERALRGETVVAERTIRNALGQRRTCEVRLVRLPAGERKLLRASFIDTTERRAAEQALLHQVHEFRAMTTTTTDGFWVVDSKGRILSANDECCRLYGYSQIEFLDLTIPQLEAARSPEETQRHIEQIMADGFARFETRHRCKDGHTIDVEISTTYLQRTGNLLTFIRDLSGRKQAEAELQRQREELAHVARVSTMGELAISIAHELNQPLGAILSNTEAAELFLQRQPPALDEIQEILADIRKDDERAGAVIRRMRALLRRNEMERERLDLNVLVEDVLRLLGLEAARRRISLTGELTAPLPPVAGDRIHLQQVLINLVMNSMDAMAKQPPGTRSLVVRTHPGVGVTVELEVIDSGPGIAAGDLPRLFEPFFTTKPSGIGMGLSIARRIIEAHQGRVWAESAATGGAMFRVSLPAMNDGNGGAEGHGT